MGKTTVYSVAVLLALAAGTAAQADVFIDDFNTPHDFVANDVTGTMWDDFIGWYTGETVAALNASQDRPGQLFMSSENGVWASSADSPLGPFLFKTVKGDFVATVKVSDYSYTPDAQGYDNAYFHNTCGLMARAFNSPDEAGAGEDWVAIDYFPVWTCGNFVRSEDNDIGPDVGHNGQYRRPLDTLWPGVKLCDPYLRLERSGNVIHFVTSPDGVTWTEMGTSPITRNDFSGLPLMVGLRQATFSVNLGYAAFDDFSVETFANLKARFPAPADGGIATPTVLQWVAGDLAAEHDVYVGMSLDDVNNATTATSGIYKGRQANTTGAINGYSITSLTPGETYYWRIDEVNDAHPDKMWKGDVWSFTPVPFKAWKPSPADSAECVSTHATLSWSLGAKAATHDVYFGTNLTSVTSASRFSAKGVLVSKNQSGTTYTPTLALDTTYYWRVDEVNSTPSLTTWKGDVWSFKTGASMPIAEAGLVGWWKLDGTDCLDAAIDSSGYDYHGTLVNGPQWIPGYDDNALKFDGRDDYVELPIGSLISGLTNSTFMLWMDSQAGGSWARAFDFGTDDPNVYMVLGPRWWFMDDMYFAITTTGEASQTQVAPTGFDLPTGWHHVAVTIDAAASTIILYYDGAELARTTGTTVTPKDLGNTTNNWLGRSHNAIDAYYMGSMDDFRIYDQALSPEKIARTMAGNPLRAWNPSPANNAMPDVEHISTLSWSAGDNATEHDVYFGTDANAVDAADTSDTTGIYRGRLDDTTYNLPDVLNANQTCYWRVDEVAADGTITKGGVWYFTTAMYLVVDDFESYGGEDTPGVAGGRVWYVWNDGFGWTSPDPGNHGNGTGAMVDLATSPVRTGAQAMRFDFDNDGGFGNIFGEVIVAYRSELTCTFASAQDWTRRGVQVLRLYFYGTVGNPAEPLYLTLKDSAAGVAVVNYENTAALAEASWHEWAIDLSTIAQAGVNLSSIKTVVIGVGEGSTAAGWGTLYIDDVRLYP